MEKMNRTILKFGLPAFVDAQDEQKMKAAFISQHKAFSLSLESKYCNLKTDIS